MPLHPDFPVVEGQYQMTPEWSVMLDSRFNRRVEDKSLVLWQPGFTAWIDVWNNNKNETAQQRLAWVQQSQALEAFSKETTERDGVLRHSYRLAEDSDDRRVAALYCFAFGQESHVQMALYFDREGDAPKARAICASLSYTLGKPE